MYCFNKYLKIKNDYQTEYYSYKQNHWFKMKNIYDMDRQTSIDFKQQKLETMYNT